jgi:hypothetical protein
MRSGAGSNSHRHRLGQAPGCPDNPSNTDSSLSLKSHRISAGCKTHNSPRTTLIDVTLAPEILGSAPQGRDGNPCTTSNAHPPPGRSRGSPGVNSSNPSKSPGRSSRLIRCPSSNHCPRSKSRQRSEQNGPLGLSSHGPRRRHCGQATSGNGFDGFIGSTSGAPNSVRD